MEYSFSAEQRTKLNALMDFMLEHNKKVNLTRITERDDVWEKHFTDSILPLELFCVPRGTSVIDVGTGAGFPGVVWDICRPDLKLTLLDSLKKRTDYLTALKAELNLLYTILKERAEILSHEEGRREQYDVAVSRAVANLPALLEYTLPFVKPGGFMLAMKGKESETEKSENALALLGGKIEDVKYYKLPSGDARTLVVVKKISQTPPKYPRKTTNISKNPL